MTGSKISTFLTNSEFFGPIAKKMAAMAHDWQRHFFTSPLKLLNGIQRNLIGSKISTSSSKLCFSVWWVNKNYRPADLSKRWHIVLRCTICGPLGLLFMHLFRWRKKECMYMYRNTKSALTTELLDGCLWNLAPHMHWGVLARSTQGRIQGRAKIGDGRGLLQESASSDLKATATNQMYRNDLEACGMKCCYFLFHSEVNFYAFIVLRLATVAFWAFCWHMDTTNCNL